MGTVPHILFFTFQDITIIPGIMIFNDYIIFHVIIIINGREHFIYDSDKEGEILGINLTRNVQNHTRKMLKPS